VCYEREKVFGEESVMAFMLNRECHCCMSGGEFKDGWHCEWCWDQYHNGKRDNDFMSHEKFVENRDKLIKRIPL
jgi:hypothetical protein